MTDRKKLLDALPRLAGGKVLIIGDLVLDHYVVGQVARISPEAPVPVVHVEQERYILGGAGNVARNIKALGGEPTIVGICGMDTDGERMRRLLREAGVTAHAVCDSERPTIRKTRIVAQNQQVVRVDYEKTHVMSDGVTEQLFDYIRDEVHEAGVIILSDYGKGLVTAAFMERLWKLLDSMENRPQVFVDPKTRNFDLYQGVDLLTPNSKEAQEGAGIELETADKHSVLRTGLKIFKKLKNANLLITLGPKGMALFQGPEHVTHIPTAARKVFDVTGAGDTVIAMLGLAVARGLDLITACELANLAAGIVVAEVGTASATVDDIRQLLEEGCELPPRSSWFGEAD
ncbi:D-glycero-beta-D-manno-heptose-7-phosphate kinase [Desulfovibrio ferrophilus]|uniref:RfaE bifunctional protein n=1 Tax=Desulfovibrio ferrophilus TaxID=241368 RepID=A0A2Z6B1R4_9BACT|nr:D-glycero-beta-D-manno-heptose-7-phosphate kinase [Desulfovibrio ferrophilus]BBD09380.1 RfaE bifunctional protein [Desulfovibrio ferrophilus]